MATFPTRGPSIQDRLLLLTFLLCLATSAEAGIFDFNTRTGGTRLWVPDGLQTIRGILIYGNGAGGDSRDEVFTPWNQGLARAHGFAVIGTSRWGNLSGDEILAWESHLDQLATLSGHPELVHAPWAPIGFSNGGQMSYGFNALRPEKTIAFIANKGCCYNDRLPGEGALQTPGILIAGELDTQVRRESIRGLFEDNRPRGALWSWIEQQGLAHEGRADNLVIPFIDEAIRLRYPSDQTPTATDGVELLPLDETSGWLADPSTWQSGLTRVEPYDTYAGDKNAAGWLLSQRVANLYRAASTYDRRADLSIVLPPPLDDVDELLEIWFSETSPAQATFHVDLSAIPDWSKIQVFNGADLLSEHLPGRLRPSELQVDLSFKPGVHAITALVTHGDGTTLSTTDPVAFTVVPEPTTTTLLLAAGFLLLTERRRRHPALEAPSPPPFSC